MLLDSFFDFNPVQHISIEVCHGIYSRLKITSMEFPYHEEEGLQNRAFPQLFYDMAIDFYSRIRLHNSPIIIIIIVIPNTGEY